MGVVGLIRAKDFGFRSSFHSSPPNRSSIMSHSLSQTAGDAHLRLQLAAWPPHPLASIHIHFVMAGAIAKLLFKPACGLFPLTPVAVALVLALWLLWKHLPHGILCSPCVFF